MTVAGLIVVLSACPQDAKVVIEEEVWYSEYSGGSEYKEITFAHDLESQVVLSTSKP